jgi:hypothetical protein
LKKGQAVLKILRAGDNNIHRINIVLVNSPRVLIEKLHEVPIPLIIDLSISGLIDGDDRPARQIARL